MLLFIHSYLIKDKYCLGNFVQLMIKAKFNDNIVKELKRPILLFNKDIVSNSLLRSK